MNPPIALKSTHGVIPLVPFYALTGNTIFELAAVAAISVQNDMVRIIDANQIDAGAGGTGLIIRGGAPRVAGNSFSFVFKGDVGILCTDLAEPAIVENSFVHSFVGVRILNCPAVGAAAVQANNVFTQVDTPVQVGP